MSNPELKNEQNSDGDWFCTDPEDENNEGCIACELCYTGAPDFFQADDNGNAFVFNQPTNEADINLCQIQLDECPVGSIGANG